MEHSHSIYLKSGTLIAICLSKRTAENIARCSLKDGDYYIEQTTEDDIKEIKETNFYA